MSDQPAPRAETVSRRGAALSALIALDMAGGPQFEPDPDLAAWKMAGCTRPDLEAEMEIG